MLEKNTILHLLSFILALVLDCDELTHYAKSFIADITLCAIAALLCMMMVLFSMSALFCKPWSVSNILSSEGVVQRCSIENVLLEISQNSQENTFIKKESLAQVFFCKICEISKNIFFTEHLRWQLSSAPYYLLS